MIKGFMEENQSHKQREDRIHILDKAENRQRKNIGRSGECNHRYGCHQTHADEENRNVGSAGNKSSDAVRIKIKQVGNGKGKHKRGFQCVAYPRIYTQTFFKDPVKRPGRRNAQCDPRHPTECVNHDAHTEKR